MITRGFFEGRHFYGGAVSIAARGYAASATIRLVLFPYKLGSLVLDNVSRFFYFPFAPAFYRDSRAFHKTLWLVIEYETLRTCIRIRTWQKCRITWNMNRSVEAFESRKYLGYLDKFREHLWHSSRRLCGSRWYSWLVYGDIVVLRQYDCWFWYVYNVWIVE